MELDDAALDMVAGGLGLPYGLDPRAILAQPLGPTGAGAGSPLPGAAEPEPEPDAGARAAADPLDEGA